MESCIDTPTPCTIFEEKYAFASAAVFSCVCVTSHFATDTARDVAQWLNDLLFVPFSNGVRSGEGSSSTTGYGKSSAYL